MILNTFIFQVYKNKLLYVLIHKNRPVPGLHADY